MDLHIVSYFRKKIAQSGQILDDDVIYLNTEDWDEKKDENSSFMWLILGSIVVGIFSILQNNMTIFYASAIVTVLPMMKPYLVSFYYDCRSRMLKRDLKRVLEEFRVLSRSHSERIDFLNSYKKYLETTGKPFITLTNEAVLGLFVRSHQLQSTIFDLMLDILSELHVGLEDYVFDWNVYQEALFQELKYDTVESCFKNANILDARFLLIRSHFWISIYLLCSKKGDPELLVLIMKEKFPELVTLIRRSNWQMRDSLNKIRFFEKECLVHPSSKPLHHVVLQNSTSRVRRDVNTLNNNICCTLLNVKKLSIMIDNDNLDDLLDDLSEALSKATQNIYECYESASDLKKSIEVLNRQRKNILGLSEQNSQNQTVTVNNEELEKNTEAVQEEIAEEQDQEFEAFTTEESQREIASVDETTADARQIMEQQSGMIRELRRHIKFLEKKQNLDAKLMASQPGLPQPDTNTVSGEICPSLIQTSPSSIKVVDEDHSSEKTLDEASRHSMETKDEQMTTAEQRISEEMARIEMVQQMRGGLGGRRDLKVFDTDNRAGVLNISNMIRDPAGGDSLQNMMSKFKKREEDTFE